MQPQEFYEILRENFPHEPTLKQQKALQLLALYSCNSAPDELFLLKGYAGTGKTSIMATLVSQLWKLKKSAYLLAPTGRAAKVLGNYAGRQAHTIHRKIYTPRKKKGGGITFIKRPNKHRNTIFIVDEASMIPDMQLNATSNERSSLLEDLVQYVYSGHGCRLILIGDTAQLPPVKLDISPALDEDLMARFFDKKVTVLELSEVVRQQMDSGILYNATALRDRLSHEYYDDYRFRLTDFNDMTRPLDGQEIMDALNDAYSDQGTEGAIVIVRSNKRANLFNQQIRQRILFKEGELEAGDFLMVVKNNYFWLKPDSEAGFVANGDIIEVLEIHAINELYGFRFATVTVRMIDYPDMKPFETVLILDTLMAETPSLLYEDSNRLYEAVREDYEDEVSHYKKFLAVKNNKYFNAMQVKFAYAITCHKSQGGQWPTVFIEQPYLPEGPNKGYFRWLYTALTRASDKVFLLGFSSTFFEED
ncbi:ATP-dependent DNA helicase [Gilvibacter sp.]|uniref:ATP-dependent DNA helicase n=1 Tax=Gilvibacter sp. TaxID=2729997 RepID=UPI003F4A5CAD